MSHGKIMTATHSPAFVWGTATAAYQVEGSRAADGREPSIWDAFDTPSVSSVNLRAMKPNGKPNVFKGENAADSDEDYVKFEESAELTAKFGFRAARLSIAWPRVMTYKPGTVRPGGAPAWQQNPTGIAHYQKVLKAYASRGIRVALTMFHWYARTAQAQVRQRECTRADARPWQGLASPPGTRPLTQTIALPPVCGMQGPPPRPGGPCGPFGQFVGMAAAMDILCVRRVCRTPHPRARQARVWRRLVDHCQ